MRRCVIDQVEMRFMARGLKGRGRGVFLVILGEEEGGKLAKKGETEVVWDCNEPSFTARAVLSVRAEEVSRLVLEVRDYGNAGACLGRATVDVHGVLATKCMRQEVELENAPRGGLVVVGERLLGAGIARGVARKGRPGTIVLRVNCAALRKKGLAMRPVTVFYELQRRRAEAGGGASWIPVYRSEDGGRRVNGAGYIEFRNAHVDEESLHNGDPSRRLRLVVFKRGEKAEHEVVCHAECSAEDVVVKMGSAPLVGMFAEYERMGAMQTMGVRKGMTNDVVVVDISVDIFMAKGYHSVLNDGFMRRTSVMARTVRLVRSCGLKSRESS